MRKLTNNLISYIISQKGNVPIPFKYILYTLLQNSEGESKKRSDIIKNQINNVNPSSFDISNFKFDLTALNKETTTMDQKGTDYSNDKIESVQIKNFRGFGPFMENKNDYGIYFKFSDGKNKNVFKKIIIYGPNGSGKSSFCEAIEYKLTGQIKECKRRGLELNKYIACRNIKPEISLKIQDKNFNEVSLDNIPLNIREKCFIEHNRIQAFALLDSKQTGDKQKDILATLIGLEDLQEYIDSFVKPNSFKLDKSIKYESNFQISKQQKLTKETEIKTLEQSLQTEVYNELSTSLKQDDVEACYLYFEKIRAIDDDIKKAEDELIRMQKRFEFFMEKEYVDLVEEINNLFLDYKNKSKKYTSQKDKISFKNLYQTVIGLKNKISNDKCPLCETDITKTAVNPFEKAELEIKNLEVISKLEDEIERIKFDLIGPNHYDKLKSSNSKILFNIQELEWQFEVIPFTDSNLCGIDKIQELEDFLGIYAENKVFFAQYFEKSNYEKKLQDGQQDKIENLKNRIDSLKKQKTIIENLWKSKEKKEYDIIIKIEELANIEKEIAAQKVKTENEKKYNEFLDQIEASYKEFYSSMTDFKKKLERDTIKNTESDILSFYKTINKGDNDCEQLESLEIIIPEKDSDKYEILLKKIDGHKISATQCLSEGHIRALGLSVILAITKKNDVPFIVFDDVVNAIDLEHRANLIELFFSDVFLKKKQLIITTHDRLFWERFCNQYASKVNKKDKNHISFILRYTKSGVVYDQYDIGFSERIESSISNYDIRQALNYCRILYETKVVDYCIKQKKEITAVFLKGQKTKDNHLIPSLDRIYTIFEEDSNIKKNKGYQNLKRDSTIWALLNQEHHAFDENNLNAIHAKTSDEILEIYESLIDFCDFLEKYSPIIKNNGQLNDSQQSLFSITKENV